MKATYIGREQGLLNDMIHGVLEDENGLLWLGTNRGLIKYNPINGSSHAYFTVQVFKSVSLVMMLITCVHIHRSFFRWD